MSSPKTLMNAKDQTLTEKATEAMRSAVRKVVEEHRLHQRPIAVWEENRVVRRIPQSMTAVREDRETYGTASNEKGL